MPSVWKSGASGCGSNCSSIYLTARLYLPFPRCCVYFSSTKGIFNLPSATVECKLSSNISNQMKVIAFITDYPVVDKIIRHLKLTLRAERPPPPQFLQQKLMMVAESGEYF